jgi:6-phosphogluconolactonase (cycloisomerase 2 family)
MLVANQDSNAISVFSRDLATGLLADEVKSSVEVEAPMRILFV